MISKNKVNFSLRVVLLATVLGTIQPKPVGSAAVNYDYGHVVSQAQAMISATATNISSAVSSITSQMNLGWLAMIEALRASTSQSTANANAQTTVQAQIADAQDNRQVTRAVETERLAAINSVRGGTTACNTITGMMGASDLFINAARWREQMHEASLDFILGETEATMAHRGPEAARLQVQETICSTNASPRLIRAGICAAGTTPQTEGTSGALSAHTFMANQVVPRSSEPALQQFLATAFSVEGVAGPPPLLGQSEIGRRVIEIHNRAASRQSAAISVVAGIQGQSISLDANQQASINPERGNPVPSGTQGSVSLQRYMDETRRRLALADPNGNNYPNGVSLRAWHELMAQRFYLDPQLQANFTQNGADANSKEIASMMSFQLYLMWEQYKQQENASMLLALVVSILNEMNTTRALQNVQQASAR